MFYSIVAVGFTAATADISYVRFYAMHEVLIVIM